MWERADFVPFPCVLKRMRLAIQRLLICSRARSDIQWNIQVLKQVRGACSVQRKLIFLSPFFSKVIKPRTRGEIYFFLVRGVNKSRQNRLLAFLIVSENHISGNCYVPDKFVEQPVRDRHERTKNNSGFWIANQSCALLSPIGFDFWKFVFPENWAQLDQGELSFRMKKA